MRKILSAFVLLLVLPAAAQAQTTVDPLTCTGYAEKRQFVEAQSWWTEPGLQTRHAHVGACIPERETVADPVRLDVRMVLHDPLMATEFSTLRVTVKGSGYEKNWIDHDFEEPCMVMTCTKWHTVHVPLSFFDKSGMQEMRLRFTNEEGRTPSRSAATMKPSMGWKVFVNNGKTKSDYTRLPYVRGKGWYTENGYCVAEHTDAAGIPDAPVSGAYTRSIQMINDDSTDSQPVTGHRVSVNPDFHMGNPGTVLLDGSGQRPNGPFTIDTTKFSDGQHRVALEVRCAALDGNNVRNSLLQGFLIYPITVANGTTGPGTGTDLDLALPGP